MAVAHNIRRRRTELGISGLDLRELLSDRGFKVHRGWVSDVENRKRTLDVDELQLLAAVLGVSPVTLMMPPAVSPEDPVPTVTGVRDARDHWDWLVGARPADSSHVDADAERTAARYRAVAQPPWIAYAEPVPHGPAMGRQPEPVTAEDLIGMGEADLAAERRERRERSEQVNR